MSSLFDPAHSNSVPAAIAFASSRLLSTGASLSGDGSDESRIFNPSYRLCPEQDDLYEISSSALVNPNPPPASAASTTAVMTAGSAAGGSSTAAAVVHAAATVTAPLSSTSPATILTSPSLEQQPTTTPLLLDSILSSCSSKSSSGLTPAATVASASTTLRSASSASANVHKHFSSHFAHHHHQQQQQQEQIAGSLSSGFCASCMPFSNPIIKSDHRVCMIPLNKSTFNHLPAESIRILCTGTYALHVEEETGRSAIVYLMVEQSLGLLIWCRGTNNGLKCTFGGSGASHSRDTPSPGRTHLTHGGSYKSKNIVSKEMQERLLHMIVCRFDSREIYSTGLEEGFIDLMHSKDAILSESRVDLSPICKKAGLKSGDINPRCCLKLLFGSSLSDNRFLYFVLPKDMITLWSQDLKHLIHLLKQQCTLTDQRLVWLKYKYLQLYYNPVNPCTLPTPADAIKSFGGRKWTLSGLEISATSSSTYDHHHHDDGKDVASSFFNSRSHHSCTSSSHHHHHHHYHHRTRKPSVTSALMSARNSLTAVNFFSSAGSRSTLGNKRYLLQKKRSTPSFSHTSAMSTTVERMGSPSPSLPDDRRDVEHKEEKVLERQRSLRRSLRDSSSGSSSRHSLSHLFTPFRSRRTSFFRPEPDAVSSSSSAASSASSRMQSIRSNAGIKIDNVTTSVNQTTSEPGDNAKTKPGKKWQKNLMSYTWISSLSHSKHQFQDQQQEQVLDPSLKVKTSIAHSSHVTFFDFTELYRSFIIRSRPDIRELFIKVSQSEGQNSVDYNRRTEEGSKETIVKQESDEKTEKTADEEKIVVDTQRRASQSSTCSNILSHDPRINRISAMSASFKKVKLKSINSEESEKNSSCDRTHSPVNVLTVTSSAAPSFSTRRTIAETRSSDALNSSAFPQNNNSVNTTQTGCQSSGSVNASSAPSNTTAVPPLPHTSTPVELYDRRKSLSVASTSGSTSSATIDQKSEGVKSRRGSLFSGFAVARDSLLAAAAAHRKEMKFSPSSEDQQNLVHQSRHSHHGKREKGSNNNHHQHQQQQTPPPPPHQHKIPVVRGVLTRNVHMSEGEEEKHRQRSLIWDAIASASIVSNSTGIERSRCDVVSLEQFVSFIRNYQKEDVSMEQACELIQRHEPDGSLRESNRLSFEGFSCYLLDKNNYAFTPELNTYLEEDLDESLSHYYMATSHNTYLTGHQLKGESSVDLYANVLKTGCRCVELDCWDGEDGSPVIYHGHTLTSKVPFVKVIRAINESAFTSSPFPVILSLENHCSITQQSKMAQIFVSIFGEKLVTSFMFESDFLPHPVLPTPNQLKHRILIKNKKLRTPLLPMLHHKFKRVVKSGSNTAATAITSSSASVQQRAPVDRTNSLLSVTSSGGSLNDDVDSDDEDDEEDEITIQTADQFASSSSPALKHKAITGPGGGVGSEHQTPVLRTESSSSQEGMTGATSLESTSITGKHNQNIHQMQSQVQQSQQQQSVPENKSSHKVHGSKNTTTAGRAASLSAQQTPQQTPSSGRKSSQVAPELSDLVNYVQAVKFRGLFLDPNSGRITTTPITATPLQQQQQQQQQHYLYGKPVGSKASAPSSSSSSSVVAMSKKSASSSSRKVSTSTTTTTASISPAVVAATSCSTVISAGTTSSTQTLAATTSSTATSLSNPQHLLPLLHPVSHGVLQPTDGNEEQQGDSLRIISSELPDPHVSSSIRDSREQVFRNDDDKAERGSLLQIRDEDGTTQSVSPSGPGSSSTVVATTSGKSVTSSSNQQVDGTSGPVSIVAKRRENTELEVEEEERWPNPGAQCYQVPSLNENTAKKLCRKSPLAVLSFTESNLMRSYPAGMRIDSSNFNPITFWAFGLQMAAINYQTDDMGSAINSALFEQNGSIGLIKKPAVMIDRSHVMFGRFNPWEKEFDGLCAIDLTITVISGQYVCPESNAGSPVVEVELIGIPVDCNKQRTRVVQRNSLNPIFNDSFVFRIAFSDLAFIRFAVIDVTSNHMTSQRIIPINCLKPGYRHVKLRSTTNCPLPVSTLFIHSSSQEEGIEVKTSAPVPCSVAGDESGIGSTAATSVGLIVTATSGTKTSADASNASLTPAQLLQQQQSSSSSPSTRMQVTGAGSVIDSSASGSSVTSSRDGTTTAAAATAASVPTRRRMFFLVVHGVTTEEPSTILKITQDSTTTDVIEQALIKANKSCEKVYDYVLIEEVAPTWDKKRLKTCKGSLQRILDADERPLFAQSRWTGEGRFVLKKLSDDPSTRAWMSTIKAASMRKQLLQHQESISDPTRTTDPTRSTDEFSSWNDDLLDNFLVCVYNVSPDQPYTILKASTTSTAQEIIQRALLKARRVEDSTNYVIMEEVECDPADSESNQQTTPKTQIRHHRNPHSKSGQQSGQINVNKRIVGDEETLYLIQSCWRSRGLFRLLSRAEAESALQERPDGPSSRPSSRASLLRWTQSAKGSFRRLSRMSSHMKSKESSTDRDSSS